VAAAARVAGPRELTFEEKEAYDILSPDEIQAKTLVDSLLEELVFAGFVKERLENESGISDRIRELAIKVADKRNQRIPAFVVNEAWAVIKSPGANRGQLELALKKAKAANDSEENTYFMMVIAVAYYRLEQYQEAERAFSDATARGMAPDIVSLSFSAMTFKRLGKDSLATDTLARAKELMRDPKRSPSAEYRAILNEATEVVDGNG
jgi:tetratricopeptide (TPR) repeat protein